MRWFVVAALAALVLAVPAQAAAPIGNAQLALMPLPKSALGKLAAGMPLALDSGPVTNAEAAAYANGKVTAKTVAKLGRLKGYALDYGNELSGRTGVTRIATEVDVYKDAASAGRGLAFWKADEQNVGGLRKLGLKVAIAEVALPRIGDDRFAYSATITVPGLKPIYGIDAYLRTGRLIAEVSVVADRATAKQLAASLLRQTQARIRAVLAGKVHERPVALPSTTPGPPPKGPDLAKLVVRVGDLGAGKVVAGGYVIDKDFSPVSEYHVRLQPAGAFGSLDQSVMLLHSVPEATATLAALRSFVSQAGAISDPTIKRVTIAPVAVRGGDEAHGEIVTIHLKTGQTVYEGVTLIRVGALVTTLTAVTPARVGPSAVQALAKLGAARLANKAPKRSNLPTS